MSDVTADEVQHALGAAEIALGNGDLETAEDAILEALSRTRQAKQRGDNDD